MLDQVTQDARIRRPLLKMVFALLLNKDVLPDTVMVHIKKVIDAWQAAQKVRALEEFMQKLRAADQLLYEQGEKYAA